MPSTRIACVLLGSALGASTQHQANPIRKVVTMLQLMQKKIEDEGRVEKALFDKFMCACDTTMAGLKKSIEGAEVKIPQLESGVKELNAAKSSLTGDIAQAKADRKEAEDTLADARSLRERDSAQFDKDSAEMRTNIDSMKRAIAALRKGLGSGFLQTSSAKVLKTLASNLDSLSNSDREVLNSFLATGQTVDLQAGDSKTSEIVGILSQMLESMEGELVNAEKSEHQAKLQFESLAKAKESQVKALTRMIESKTARLGEVGVTLVNTQADLDEASTGIVEDKSLLATTEEDCAKRQKEQVVSYKERQEELLAISQTIKILNDDDAQGIFSKTLPKEDSAAASFLQVQASTPHERRTKAARLLRAAARKHHSTQLSLAAMAVRSQKGFDKIIKMIDDMIALLKEEQSNDDSKKAYCNKEIDEAEDKLKGLNQDGKDAKKAILQAKEKTETLNSDIESLKGGIAEQDKQVEEAGAQRKKEHEVFVETMAANNAAKELLGMAKDRLNKFYNPKSSLVQVTQANSVVGAMDDDSTDDGASNDDAGSSDDAVTFVQTGSRSHAHGSGGVIELINQLIGDIETSIQELNFEEEQAQKDYEEMVAESADKRALNAEAVTEKEGFKSVLEEKIHKAEGQRKGILKESMDTMGLIEDLHVECDTLLSSFDVRKQARSDEIEALRKASSVLQGGQ